MIIGDEIVVMFGLNVVCFCLLVFVIGVLIIGVMVVFFGMIGFVGLMMFYIVWFLVGGDYQKFIFVLVLLGVVFVLWVDIVVCMIMVFEDMFIGIVIGFIGGCFFVWLFSCC